MVLLISAILYILTAIPVLSLLRIKQLPRYVCAFFIVFFAEIILTGNMLGLLQQLDNKGLWFGIQTTILLIAWGAWFLGKHPVLFSFQVERPDWHSLRVIQKISLILLGIAVFAGYCTLVYLILAVPPNNNDSMVVHLVRVGYWLQHGSFTPWNSIIERQVIYPYNAQIIVLWTILLHGTDLFAAFLQFFSVLFTGLGIYCIGREIGGNRFQSALAALFYLTFPQVLLQATTTQDDLVVTCFLILGSYFFLRWYGHNYADKNDFLLAALSLMIAIGIKPTAFYFFIGFAVFIVLLVCIKKMQFKQILQLGIACIVAFLIFSSYGYINNTIYFHNPLGPAEFVKSESGAFNGNVFRKAEVNTGRFFYQFLSLDGLPKSITQPLQNAKIAIASRMPSVFNTTTEFVKDPAKQFSLSAEPGINEDFSWFGPISFLLLLPAFFMGIIQAVKTKNTKIAFLLLVPFFLMLGIGILRPGWDPYQGRYFNPGIAISMPLVTLLINRKNSGQITMLVISIIAVLVLAFSVLMNDSKPIVTQRTVARDCSKPSVLAHPTIVSKAICHTGYSLFPILPAKIDIASLNSLERETYSSGQHYAILNEFEKLIPAKSRIGLSLLNGDWEYPFFGKHFEYALVPVLESQSLQDPSWLAQNKIDTLIVHTTANQILPVDPSFVLKNKIIDPQTNTPWLIYRK
jgi:4-amino-4-deoxy-L-arabinose transferase-like glycosyltransferase